MKGYIHNLLKMLHQQGALVSDKLQYRFKEFNKRVKENNQFRIDKSKYMY